MNHEASTALYITMTSVNIKYQLVTQSNHIENNTERSIKALKNYFIARLCRIYKDFNL